MTKARWALPAVAAALLLAGCSKTYDSTTSTGSPAGTAGATTTVKSGGSGGGDYGDKSPGTTAKTSGTTAVGASGAGEIKTASSKLGEILVDDKGMTLYEFKKDTGAASACTGGCATAWPPATGTPKAGGSLSAADLGTAPRDDGTQQITYKGHRLYRFAGDDKAGDVNGQGTGGVWYVVGPDGNMIDKDE